MRNIVNCPAVLSATKHGARNGHQPHLKKLFPPEFVKEQIHLKPDACTCGSTNLKYTDQEPLRHQIVDIPPIKPEVIEYIQHIYQCRDCGAFIYGLCRKKSIASMTGRIGQFELYINLKPHNSPEGKQYIAFEQLQIDKSIHSY
jgi:hypothetical protein